VVIYCSGEPRYITTDEIGQLHSEALDDIARLDYRAQDAGCEILWRDEANPTRIRNRDGAVTPSLYAFGTVEETIAAIERGDPVEWHTPENCARCGEPVLQGFRLTHLGQMHPDCHTAWQRGDPQPGQPAQPTRPAQAAQVAQPAMDYELDIPTEFEPAPTDPEEADLQRMAWISMMSRRDALALAVVLIDQLGSDIVATIEELDQMADSELQEVLAVLMREMVDLEEYHKKHSATW
jgi:hypothetical protein